MAELFVSAWLVSVIVGAMIGEALKGRGTLGAALGLLLGPLGWLIILVLDDHRTNERKCPECLGKVPEEARRCMHCGYKLVADEPTIGGIVGSGGVSDEIAG